MVMINGENVDASGKTVADYLKEAGYPTEYIVVELNREILPREIFPQVILKDDDEVEIVRFVGGG